MPDAHAFVREEVDLERVAGVAADLAQVTDWSIFWRPVWNSFQGRDYGGPIARATGWTARYNNNGPKSGPESVIFALTHGGFVSASETNVQVTSPNVIWSVRIDRAQLTPELHQQIRDLAADRLHRYAATMAKQLGQPNVGPAGYRAGQAPPGLRLDHDGVIAAWRRPGGTIQIAAIEINDYEDDPVSLHIRVQVRPSESGHHD